MPPKPNPQSQCRAARAGVPPMAETKKQKMKEINQIYETMKSPPSFWEMPEKFIEKINLFGGKPENHLNNSRALA